MKIIVWGCLIAQMKRFDALITTQKPQLSARSHFLKNQEKPGIFLDFLRCNQCIKTLHLSYQTPQHNDFNFLACNGFFEIFSPMVGGVKNKLKKFEKYFCFYTGKRHLKPPAPEEVRNSPPPPPPN